MSANMRVDLQEYSDRELVDLFERRRERAALVELYERYRVSIGNYLYRDIKNKEVVADTFNSMMLDLVTNFPSQVCERSVSTKLFAMAHERRLEYVSKGTLKVTEHDHVADVARVPATNTSQSNNFKNKLARLPRLHRDVVELAYSYDFTFDEVAEIIGCNASVVSNCLSHIKNEHLSLLCGSNKSQASLDDHIISVEA